MPKTAVDIDRGLEFGQYNIWLSGIPFIVFPEPKTVAMKKTPNYDLRFCIFTPDMRHIHTANFFTMIISHFSLYPNMMQDVQQSP